MVPAIVAMIPYKGITSIPGICNPNIKVAATADPPIVARAVPRLRLTDRLIRSPETNPNGTINREIKRNEAVPGITKYMS